MQQEFSVISFPEIATCCLVVISAYFILRRDPRINYHLGKFGGPISYPLVGSAFSLLGPSNELFPMFDKFDERHGPVFAAWIGNFMPFVCVADPDIIESCGNAFSALIVAVTNRKVLSTTTHIDKGNQYDLYLRDWLGDGLLTAKRDKWFPRRKLLTPSFHFKILEDFNLVFNDHASIFVNCLIRDKHDTANAKTFDIETYIKNCTLDIICETAMGKRINAQTSTINKNYIDAVNGFTALLLEKFSKPWYRIPWVFKLSSLSAKQDEYLRTLKGFTKEIIRTRKEEKSANKTHSEKSRTIIYGKERKAFLDLLLDLADEDGQALTDSDILEEVDTFMFEGHDTTAVNLVWTILMLASHPKCQKRVQEELDEIFSDDPSRDVTTADISKMKYLECCVKETLRLYPSVPFIMRQIDSDIMLDNGNIIPKGVTMAIGIYYVHRNPNHFFEPNVYNPDRFSQENYVKRHPYAYIPFAAGPRNCIGQKFAMMEEKVILAKLFRAFEIETEETMESLRKTPDVVLRCDNGAHVILRKRKVV